MDAKDKNKYGLGEQERIDYITNNILPHLPDDSINRYMGEIYRIVELYAGDDIEVLSICAAAAEKQNLEVILEALNSPSLTKKQAIESCHKINGQPKKFERKNDIAHELNIRPGKKRKIIPDMNS